MGTGLAAYSVSTPALYQTVALSSMLKAWGSSFHGCAHSRRRALAMEPARSQRSRTQARPAIVHKRGGCVSGCHDPQLGEQCAIYGFRIVEDDLLNEVRAVILRALRSSSNLSC